jgi:anti-anti-sigma factor
MTLDFIDMDIGDVTEITLIGRITLGQGVQKLREAIDSVLERGRRLLLLNFDEVFYVDSSGLGELVAVRRKVADHGGEVKLMKLNQITRDLIQVTRIYMLFEVFADEASALESFKKKGSPA